MYHIITHSKYELNSCDQEHDLKIDVNTLKSTTEY